ncbi:hypothetical protein HDU93_005361, partial [Gonapodya sp. JEL0774]
MADDQNPFDSDDPLVLDVTLDTFEQIDKPKSYKQAIYSPYAKYWKLAMEEELGALRTFGTL